MRNLLHGREDAIALGDDARDVAIANFWMLQGRLRDRGADHVERIGQLHFADLAAVLGCRHAPTDAQRRQAPRFGEGSEGHECGGGLQPADRPAERGRPYFVEIAVSFIAQHHRAAFEERVESSFRQHTAGRIVRRADDRDGVLMLGDGSQNLLQRQQAGLGIELDRDRQPAGDRHEFFVKSEGRARKHHRRSRPDERADRGGQKLVRAIAHQNVFRRESKRVRNGGSKGSRLEIGVEIPWTIGHPRQNALFQGPRKIEGQLVLVEFDLRFAQFEGVGRHSGHDAAAHTRLLAASDRPCSGRPSNSARRRAYGAIA